MTFKLLNERPEENLIQLLQLVCQEESLPLELYTGIITQKEDSIQYVLNVLLTRRSVNYLQEKFALPNSNATWIEKVVAQRLAIDRGENELSLKLFASLIEIYHQIPEPFKPWVHYFRGKALQHSGHLSEAFFLYKSLELLPLSQELSLFVTLDLTYVHYNMNDQAGALLAFETLRAKFEDLDPTSYPFAKIGTSIGYFYFAFGNLTKAIETLNQIVKFPNCDPFYHQQATLILFQALIETNQLQSATALLPQCMHWFLDSKSTNGDGFILFWLRLETSSNGNKEQRDRLYRRCLATRSFRKDLRYRVDTFLAMQWKPLNLKSFLNLARECRSQGDHYSRCCLWLENIRQDNLKEILSPKRILDVLSYLQIFFDKNGLTMESLRTKIERNIRSGTIPSLETLRACIQQGHGYLVCDLIERTVGNSREVVIFDGLQKEILWTNNELIPLGKDQITLPLISFLLTKPGRWAPVEEIITGIYKEPKTDYHSFKKVEVAVRRINQRLNRPLLIFTGGKVQINSIFYLLFYGDQSLHKD